MCLFIFIMSCQNYKQKPGIQETIIQLKKTDTTKNMNTAKPELPTEALYLDSIGLTNVRDIDSSIQVKLRYSSTDNFLGIDLYGALEQAYLQPDVAEKLAKASAYLQQDHPNLRLLVWDAVRPVSVQNRMWEVCDVPLKRRHWYVTPPGKRSLHNYGAAVDVTLIDTTGNKQDMGTDFDHFGPAAYTDRNEELTKTMLVSPEAINNRLILHAVMEKAGFTGIKYEWWHFNACSRDTAETKYEPVISLNDSTKTAKR